MEFSQTTKAIFEALAKFQGEVSNPKADADNPFFKSKYAKLDDILEMVRPLLSKHGLSVIQPPCSDETGVGVTTLITHSSGEYIKSDPFYLKLNNKQDAQAGGSAITYSRRYALASVLGIAQEDDDGNKASENKPPKEEKAPAKTKPFEEFTDEYAVEKWKCVVCGKVVSQDIGFKSMEANGKVYCSGTCKKKDVGA